MLEGTFLSLYVPSKGISVPLCIAAALAEADVTTQPSGQGTVSPLAAQRGGHQWRTEREGWQGTCGSATICGQHPP